MRGVPQSLGAAGWDDGKRMWRGMAVPRRILRHGFHRLLRVLLPRMTAATLEAFKEWCEGENGETRRAQKVFCCAGGRSGRSNRTGSNASWRVLSKAGTGKIRQLHHTAPPNPG